MNKKSIQELLEQGIISEEVADRIGTYYLAKQSGRSNRLIIIFGILGALLVGLGVILILAHNWDNFHRGFKVFLAFLPLLIGQGICAFVLRSQNQSRAWREGSSVFLFFAIGAVIALIGQIYNLPGSTESFVLTWMLLAAPLIYMMDSKALTLFFIFGITYYAWIAFLEDVGGENFQVSWYCLLILIPLPFYWDMYRSKDSGLAMGLLHWLLPISLSVGLASFCYKDTVFIVIAYMSLLALFFMLSKLPNLDELPLSRNGYRVLSTLGSLFILMPLTFAEPWVSIIEEMKPLSDILQTVEFRTALVIFFGAIVGLIYSARKVSIGKHPLYFLFIVFTLLFLLTGFKISPRIAINLIVLLLGVFYIRLGSIKEHFGILNFGLSVITVLIICRFFDFEISYIIRGLLFVAVGMGFFVANYRMYKKRLS